MAARAVDILPVLRDAVVVRQWAGLRVMSPDVAPIYVESERHPGAWATTSHSGGTLAAAHARPDATPNHTGARPGDLSLSPLTSEQTRISTRDAPAAKT